MSMNMTNIAMEGNVRIVAYHREGVRASANIICI